MDKQEDLVKRYSDHYLRLIQLIFGVVFVQGLVLNRDLIVNPLTYENVLALFCLFVILSTTVMSWMDFHRSVERNPYIIERSTEKLRVVADVLVVISYLYVLFSIESIKGKPYADLSHFLFGYCLIFFFYFVSGWVRIRTHGITASRKNLILRYLIIYTFIWAAYTRYYYEMSSLLKLDLSVLNLWTALLVFLVMISYRVVRTRGITKRALLQKTGLRIGIDVDGVLGNQIDGIIRRVKQKYGISFGYQDVTEWEYKIANSDIAKEIEEALLEDSSYSLEMELHQGAREAVEEIWQKNWITIITARPKELDISTKRWLTKQKIFYDEYINSRTVEKSTHGVHVLIDDYVGNVIRVLEDTSHYAILFDQPWNQQRSSLKKWLKQGRSFVVKEWKEIPPMIESLPSKIRGSTKLS